MKAQLQLDVDDRADAPGLGIRTVAKAIRCGCKKSCNILSVTLLVFLNLIRFFFYLQHALKVHIDSRRLLLRYLRETDYKKFEWLLEKLNIAYKPRPLVFLLERKLLADK